MKCRMRVVKDDDLIPEDAALRTAVLPERADTA